VSEPENFLARWTRLKREAERREAEMTARADAARVPSQPTEATPSEPTRTIGSAEPTVDPSTLPPIEEIIATTDIRAYLVPGVPAELTRAALRRAWLADPTIRDFVGIAENQWDFNDPNGIPGFGPLEDAGRLVARLLGDEQWPTAPSAGSPVLEAVRDPASLPDAPATIGEPAAALGEQPDPASPCETNMPASAPIAAPQKVNPVQPARAMIPRGHGGALPK
jgi:hypothetical protein